MSTQPLSLPYTDPFIPDHRRKALPGRRSAQPRNFLYPREVADYFGVNLSTVRRWAILGTLKAVFTPGGRCRFPVKEFYSQVHCRKLAGENPPPVAIIPHRRRTAGPSAAPATTAAPVRSAATPVKPPAPKIMVVEDNNDIRHLIAAIFQSKGYRVAACAHGQEALDRLKEEHFPAVLSDISMPVLNGQALVCTLKQLYRNSKVLMMSAGYTYRLAEFQAYGALGILSKSIGLNELYRRVRDMEQERRTVCRLPVRLPLSVNREPAGTTLDLSADGVLFRAERQLSPGATLNLCLHGKNGNALLAAAGTVVRSQPEANGVRTAVYFKESMGDQLGALVRDGLVRPENNWSAKNAAAYN